MPSSADNPYIDAAGRTDAETYLMGCLDGSIVAGQKMIKLAEKMLPRIRNGYKRWHYDAGAATRPVEFIESFLCIPSGKLNVPFILEPYERMIIELTFGFVDDEGVRQIHYTLVEESRKNGKTSLCAAIEIYLLVADGEGAPQIYNCATSKSQASLAFGAVWRMVRQSPKLMKMLHKGTVVERAESGIICNMNMGYIVPLSKQSDHLDGLDVHGCIFDEMSAAESRDVFDLLRQGMGAKSRRQPLLIAITTQGFHRDGLWDSERDYAIRWLEDKLEEEDDQFLGILFEQDDRSEVWGDPELWAKSNPGLGTVKSLEYMRGEVLKAKNDPSYLPTVLTKEFCIAANQATSFLTYEESHNPETFEFDPKKFRYCVVGMDAADTLDLNCATALFMTPGDDHIYRRSMYWIAEEQLKVNKMGQKGRDNGAPYEEWAAKGYIRIVPGNKVPRTVFLDFLDELYHDGVFCVGIGYDRWGFQDIEDKMKLAVGEKNCQPIPFGVKSLSIPMKQLKADMRVHRIVDNNNPIDHWCNANVTVKPDINGNIQPIKRDGAATRIDGFAALLCGYKYLIEHWDYYQMCIGG